MTEKFNVRSEILAAVGKTASRITRDSNGNIVSTTQTEMDA